ncbi:MAG: ATP synthase F0 subunit B [Desulfurivibrio sp.]|nr:ATP synthase F0 subunit B [Desulfurivibrio sp.]
MITVDLTMLFHLITILLLAVVLNSILYRPILDILKKRRQKIDSLHGDIEKFEKNRQLRLQEFERKLQEARNQAKSEFDAARSAAQQESNSKLAARREEEEKNKAAQLKQIGEQFSTARSELLAQVNVFAEAMATKILGRAI